jgi:hypothetical protein
MHTTTNLLKLNDPALKVQGLKERMKFFYDEMKAIIHLAPKGQNVINPVQAKRSSGTEHDIVEGPVANDDVNDRIIDYLAGIVSKTDFLNELSFHKPTHQICLCTPRSLQMIEPIDKRYYIDVKHISKPIIEKLINEQSIDKYDASDMFYNSKTFSQLSDKTTEFYKKQWSEIYDMLKNELGLK